MKSIGLRSAVVGVALCAAAGFVTHGARADEGSKEATRGLRYPSLTPDGKTVVFAWHGDIWRMPVAGGAATRLTMHDAQDTKPRVSPDGNWIVFSSKRTGNYDVFVMPIDGGAPRQLTYHSAADIASDWSPDGKKVLFFSSRDPQPYGNDLYEIDVAGGSARRVTRDGGRDGAYSPDGKSVAYVRGFSTPYQDGYEGSANLDVFVVDLAGGTPRRLTTTPGNEANPCWSADGSTIWCLRDTKGDFNFVAIAFDPAGKGSGGEEKALTSWKDADTRRPALSWDRKTVAFERDGRLFTLDLTSPGAKEKALDLVVESDIRNAGIDVRTLTDGAEHVSVSSDGQKLAVAVHGDLWSLSSSGGEATRLTEGPAADDWPRFSPDGRRLAYFSDAKGTNDIYVLDLQTKESRMVAASAKDDAFPAWSPDGRKLVYTSNRGENKDLWVLDLETGVETQLTKDPKDDDDATFSPDGRSIAFDSGRGGSNHAIYVMSIAEGESSAKKVSPGSAFEECPSFSPDGSMIAYHQNDQAGGGAGIWVVRTTGGPAVQVSRDGQTPCWSPRSDWIYFDAERGGEKGIWRVRPPASIEAGERVSFSAKIQVDRRKEFADLFDEAWEKLKNGFYDKKMNGIDWEGLKKKYRPLAADAEIKDEFYNVVSQMLGELRASHLGIFPGSEEDDGLPRGGAATGSLGLELVPAGSGSAGRVVAYVQPKGPAAGAGVAAGDVVKSVAGKALDAGVDLDQVLAGSAGKDVALVFTKKDGGAEKTATVKAIGSGAASHAKYEQWVDASRKTVEDKTKGRAGYIHLSQMDQPNLQKFNVALGALLKNKKVRGLVLDVRNNGGGNIHPQLLDALSNRPYVQMEVRDAGSRVTQPSLYWGKPVVLLINERSFSDAEVFPWSFRALKLGKIVGMPTAGGVIGTNDITLSDGSKFRIPRVGWYGLDGTNLEGLGVKPDILVEETIEDRLEGRDPQLAKAIEVIDGEIRGLPPEPGAAAAPDPKDLPENPIADAKVGEWVKMRSHVGPMPTDPASMLVTFRVTAVTDDEVTLERILETGAKAGPAVHEERRKDFKDPAEGEVTKETVTVNGTELHCTVVSFRTDRGLEKRWMTNEVPVKGTVRLEIDGKLISELVEWGTGDKKPEGKSSSDR